MKVRLLKTGAIMTCIAQDKETKSGFFYLTENFGVWFDVDEFEFIN